MLQKMKVARDQQAEEISQFPPHHQKNKNVRLLSNTERKYMKVKRNYEERQLNMIKTHCIHVWQCYNKTPCFVQLAHANKTE